MKAQKSHKKLIAFSLAILVFVSLACFSSCNETEADTTSDIIANESTAPEIIDGKYTSYNEDGTVNYEEFYYDSGAVSKRIEYNYKSNSLTERTETDFDESGKMTLQTLYTRGYITIRKYDSNENCVEINYGTDNNGNIGKTVIEYDNDNNIIIATLTKPDNEIVMKCELTYNENGALIGEKRYIKEEDPSGYYVQGYYIIEYNATYEPEDPHTKHEHLWGNYPSGYFLRRYDRDLVKEAGLSEVTSYKRIVSATYYNNSAISSTINREYGENGDYMIHEINYKADSSIQNEMYYDKDGNKKQFIRYDENGEKYITNYD